MHQQTHWFTQLTQIKPSEFKSALVSFMFIFILMSSYMIVKPVRDALPSDWGKLSLPQIWTYTFVVSTIAVSVYNLAASFVSLRTLVPSVFCFFAASFIGIYVSAEYNLITREILGKIVYVWISVFSLFHISVFWSFLSNHYNKEQSKRMFGFISTGASAGAICGPTLVIILKDQINEQNILLIVAGVLLSTLPLIAILNREFAKTDNEEKSQNLSPNPFSGFFDLINHKRLSTIAAFIFFFTGAAAFLYFMQTELLSEYSRAERNAILAKVELATNTATIVIGMFATNRIARKLGMPTTLAIIPVLIAALFLILTLHPAIFFILAMQVIRRTGNYAITRPAREILFTAVDKEARFKTKPIIDVAVYRGGDVCWIYLITHMSASAGFSLPQILMTGAGICIIWAAIGFFLGKAHENDSKDEEPSDDDNSDSIPHAENKPDAPSKV